MYVCTYVHSPSSCPPHAFTVPRDRHVVCTLPPCTLLATPPTHPPTLTHTHLALSHPHFSIRPGDLARGILTLPFVFRHARFSTPFLNPGAVGPCLSRPFSMHPSHPHLPTFHLLPFPSHHAIRYQVSPFFSTLQYTPPSTGCDPPHSSCPAKELVLLCVTRSPRTAHRAAPHPRKQFPNVPLTGDSTSPLP